jgi:hypothetical protein
MFGVQKKAMCKTEGADKGNQGQHKKHECSQLEIEVVAGSSKMLVQV